MDENSREESFNQACKALNIERKKYEKNIEGRALSGLPNFEKDIEEHIDNWLEKGVYYLKKQISKLKVVARYRLYKSRVLSYFGVKKGKEEYLKLLKKIRICFVLKEIKEKKPFNEA